MRSPWSALGPHGVEIRWSWAGTSGQRRRIRIAGQRPLIVSTSDSEAARRWVRIPPDGCRAPPGRLPTRQVVIADGPHPPAKLGPVAARCEPRRPRRVCPDMPQTWVHHGQQRSVAGAGELRHPRMPGCRTVRPKLVVFAHLGHGGAAHGRSTRRQARSFIPANSRAGSYRI
jgi:hypothetical protein